MSKFKIELAGTFEADDFEHALALVSDHFTKLAYGIVPPDLFDPNLEQKFSLKEIDLDEQ